LAWRTVEECRKIPEQLSRIPAASTVILDCATLWIARLLTDRRDSGRILDSAAELVRIARRRRLNLIVVSNEVGCGVIPPSRLGRKYQDALGSVNTLLAGKANRVLLMTAGIARRIK
jgi:adenosylcobinamide kinase/adenosylcobinamide-phosphate guanylyltransferase